MEALASKELTSTPSPAQRRTVPSSSSLESRLRPVTATSLRLEPLLAARPSACITAEQRMPKILGVQRKTCQKEWQIPPTPVAFRQILCNDNTCLRAKSSTRKPQTPVRQTQTSPPYGEPCCEKYLSRRAQLSEEGSRQNVASYRKGSGDPESRLCALEHTK